MPNPQTITLTKALATSFAPTRQSDVHKWSVGGVVVVAGSPDYPGAAILASRAAGRAGAGIVILASSRSVAGTVASAIPEVAHVTFGETESNSGAHRALEAISKSAEKGRTVLIGPGLGIDASTEGLLGGLLRFGARADATRGHMGFGVQTATTKAAATAEGGLFERADLTFVIDADGLNWLAGQSEWWTQLPESRVIVTPHPGELARLLDTSVDDVLANPIKVAVDAAAIWKQVVLFKGPQAVITDGKTTYVGESARPSLATAGTGDVLAGTVAALLAQTGNLLESAALAAYVGPKAAETLETDFGVGGLIATDLPDAIARSLAALAS